MTEWQISIHLCQVEENKEILRQLRFYFLPQRRVSYWQNQHRRKCTHSNDCICLDNILTSWWGEGKSSLDHHFPPPSSSRSRSVFVCFGPTQNSDSSPTPSLSFWFHSSTVTMMVFLRLLFAATASTTDTVVVDCGCCLICKEWIGNFLMRKLLKNFAVSLAEWQT